MASMHHKNVVAPAETGRDAVREPAKLADVARLSGYSLATAWRVLNGHPSVGRLERESVLEAAKQLGYVPNGTARALRSTRTRLVGAIIPTLNHAIYATMVDALQTRLAEREVSLIVNTSSYDLEFEFGQVRLLVERGVESVILVGSDHLPKTIQLLRQKSIGYVFTYTNAGGDGATAIGFDNAKAGAGAARYLDDLGHRSFAIIAGVIAGNDRAAGRRDGFLIELARLGHDARDVHVVEATYDAESGRQAMRVIAQLPRMPTAVFCGSDVLAAGALKYCESQKIAVPEQVSIIGFDNLEIATLTSPELTTLEVPARDMGIFAAEYALADALQRKVIGQRELAVRLIVRGSTGRAPISR